MSLKNVKIDEVIFDDIENSLFDKFYRNCFNESNHLRRAVGFFSAAIFSLANKEIVNFAKQNGKIQLICSPLLSKQDIEAIKNGYSIKEKIEESLLKELEIITQDENKINHLKLISTLIGHGVLDIKIIYKNIKNHTNRGIAHLKIGLFKDIANNKIAFTGSNNESVAGWGNLTDNDSDLDVLNSYKSWENSQTVSRIEKILEEIWLDQLPGFKTDQFPDAVKKRILKYRKPGISIEEAYQDFENTFKNTKIEPLKLWKHQSCAIHKWKENNYVILLAHATGSGKTLTAIEAIKYWEENKGNIIIIVPTILLVDQWYKEITDRLGEKNNIFRLSSKHLNWKKSRIVSKTTSSDLNNILIVTSATASKEEFIKEIKNTENILCVWDEVHNAGAPQNQKLLIESFKGKIGLSATPQRYGDKKGTELIKNYYSNYIDNFTIEDALSKNLLSQYKYFTENVFLDEQEIENWIEISKKINRQWGRNKSNDISDSNGYLDYLIRERRKIITNANTKISKAIDIIKNHYRNNQQWIVYTDNASQVKSIRDKLKNEGIESMEYYSYSDSDGPSVLKQFQELGGILVSIRCLDEGVNIPSIDNGLFVASTMNSRQFIQRRGRILRKHKNKTFANIYDLTVLPKKEDYLAEGDLLLPIFRAELTRQMEFGYLSINNSYFDNDLNQILKTYNITKNDLIIDNYDEIEENTNIN